MTTNILPQLDSVLSQLQSLQTGSKYDDLSDQDVVGIAAVVARGQAVVVRVTGPSSTYSGQIEDILNATLPLGVKATQIGGVVNGLRADVAAGYTDSLIELVHADLFSDFLEMAEHLLDNGFKDAAAVIAGSSLEAHLGQLCGKHGLQTKTTKSGKQIAKRASTMNVDLRQGNVYNLAVQKSVTAWLDIRNNAAHGKYGEYSAGEVKILIAGMRHFIATNPA